MAKTRVKRDLARKAINFLLRKASEDGGKRFQVNKYTVIPKAAFTKDGLLLVFTKTLSEFADRYGIESIIIDVFGLHENKVTQLEIYENGEIVYSPGKNRNECEVQEFIKLLAQVYGAQNHF